jgi:hypothetical protein
LGALAAAAAALSAQELLPVTGGVVRPLFSDTAILEEEEIRKDLPCTAAPTKPTLGFDLKYHTGYDVTVPLKELTGQSNQLTMVFRVVPAAHPQEPVYFSQHVPVPQIDEDAKGDANLHGAFDVGEGKYHVSWLMRDRAERVCSTNWDIEAFLPPRDKQMPLNISPGAVAEADTDPFREEPPLPRLDRGPALNVKVIVNFAPQESTSAALQPSDMSALVSILRGLDRDPHIGKFSLVAFNMQEQRVFYRQDRVSRIDFPQLGAALKSLNPGTVNLQKLVHKHSDSEFLSAFLSREIGGNPEQPDAVIIAGPKVVVDDSVAPDALRDLGEVKFPVFYMNCNLDPTYSPWRDPIGAVVHNLKGAEYSISRPRDMFFALSEIMGRVVKSKFGATAAPSSQ